MVVLRDHPGVGVRTDPEVRVLRDEGCTHDRELFTKHVHALGYAAGQVHSLRRTGTNHGSTYRRGGHGPNYDIPEIGQTRQTRRLTLIPERRRNRFSEEVDAMRNRW